MGNILSKKLKKNIIFNFENNLLLSCNETSYITEDESPEKSSQNNTLKQINTTPSPPSYTLKRPENIDFDYKYFDIEEGEDFFFNKKREGILANKRKEKTS